MMDVREITDARMKILTHSHPRPKRMKICIHYWSSGVTPPAHILDSLNSVSVCVCVRLCCKLRKPFVFCALDPWWRVSATVTMYGILLKGCSVWLLTSLGDRRLSKLLIKRE